MKIPIIPLAVSAALIGGAIYLFNSMGFEKKVFDAPKLSKFADVDGTETELSMAPDGTRLLAVASGDLWLLNTQDGSRQRLTETPEPESFPSWAPDGKRFSFTRGRNTFESAVGQDSSQLFKENAVSMAWSATGRQAFVRDRALWLTDAAGLHERSIVAADADPEITIRRPRFSPDASQISFVKTTLGLTGEVWVADATNGKTRSLVADRWAENPLDSGWLAGGAKLVYLTNRSGAYALWVIDLVQNTIAPLTGTLNGMPLGDLGLTVSNDRILLPRHLLDSDIVASDGTVIAKTKDPEFEPAASPDGQLVAYTVQKDNRFEIWTADVYGGSPAFRTLGTQPRFSPDGFQLVYTQTDIQGRVDLRKLDIRDSASVTITDAPEVDFESDWSPDGRTIVFASGHGSRVGLWSMPSTGGKRQLLRESGYFPRFSPDSRSIAFWSDEGLWTMAADGSHLQQVRGELPQPLPSVWIKGVPKIARDPEIANGQMLWPQFDVLPDGRLLTARISILETAIWSIDLTYKTVP